MDGEPAIRSTDRARTELCGKVELRDEAEADGDCIALDEPLGCGEGMPVRVHAGNPHSGDAIIAYDLDDTVATQIGHAVAREGGDEAAQVTCLAETRGETARLSHTAEDRIVRLHDGGHLRAMLEKGRGHGQEEGSSARDDDPAAGQHSLPLHERLRTAAGHHAGQRPPGKGKRAVEGAGREDDGARIDGSDLLAMSIVTACPHDQPPTRAFECVGGRARPIVHISLDHEPVEIAREGGVVETRAGQGRHVGASVVLAARSVTHVDERNAAPGARGHNAGGHTGSTRADHGDVALMRHSRCPPAAPRDRRRAPARGTRGRWARR